MEKSPVMWMVGQVSWLITALASINIGLVHFDMAFMIPLWGKYVVGIAGLVCLYLMILSVMGQQK